MRKSNKSETSLLGKRQKQDSFGFEELGNWVNGDKLSIPAVINKP